MLGGITGKGFMPGVSGNPSGRPKGSVNLWARVRRILMEETVDGGTVADQVAKALVDAAKEGKWPHLKEIIDREEGPIAVSRGDEDPYFETDEAVDSTSLPPGAVPPLAEQGPVQDRSGGPTIGENGDSETPPGSKPVA